jgi:hypothetical protein
MNNTLNNTIVDAVKARRSVRSFDGNALIDKHVALIQQFIDGMTPPFGSKPRIQIVGNINNGSGKPLKLGTYGWVKGAKNFMTLVHNNNQLDQIAAAYNFEQVILYCTTIGVATCWLGGSFSRADFKKCIQIQDNQKLSIVSPLGYPSDKTHFIERFIVNADKHHSTRKPFENIFFHKDFDTTLNQQTAGVYYMPLEMVRLAPSANNKQPWKVILDNDNLHFFYNDYFGFGNIDIGIALCHFGETCKELNVKGYFKVLDIPDNKKDRYAMSWIGG